MPDEYGNETGSERRKRLAAERQRMIDEVNAAEAKRKKNRQEEAAWERAEREAGQRLDKPWEDEVGRLFGEDLGQIEDNIRKYGDATDKDVQAAIRAIEEGKKAMQGGVFSGPNRAKATKKIKQNQKAIKSANQKAKAKKGGCLGALAVLAAGGAGLLYAAYEGVSVVASALF